jgi:hypothetical protein
MGDMTFRKLRLGNAPELGSALAGGTLEEGDIGKFDTNSAIVKMAVNETAADLVLVLNDAASGEEVSYIRLRQGVIIEGVQQTAVGDVGDLVGIDLDTTTCTFGGTGTAFFEITAVVDATARIVQAERVA